MLDKPIFSRLLPSRKFGNFRDFVRSQSGFAAWFCGKGDGRVQQGRIPELRKGKLSF